jgi:hypothetical protein
MHLGSYGHSKCEQNKALGIETAAASIEGIIVENITLEIGAEAARSLGNTGISKEKPEQLSASSYFVAVGSRVFKFPDKNCGVMCARQTACALLALVIRGRGLQSRKSAGSRTPGWSYI